jgi:multidrug resistance efflux pump
MDILELIEKRKALQGADIGKSSIAQPEAIKAGKRSEQRDKRDREKERRRVQNSVERLEKQLAEREKEEKELQATIMKGGVPADQLQKGYERLGELAQRIAGVMEQWESSSAELQSLER